MLERLYRPTQLPRAHVETDQMAASRAVKAGKACQDTIKFAKLIWTTPGRERRSFGRGKRAAASDQSRSPLRLPRGHTILPTIEASPFPPFRLYESVLKRDICQVHEVL